MHKLLKHSLDLLLILLNFTFHDYILYEYTKLIKTIFKITK